MAALAAEAADDEPRAAIMAAPRPAIFGMKTSVFQSGSVIIVLDGLAVAGGVAVVGVHGRAVVAPDAHLLDGSNRAVDFSAIWLTARWWSRRIRAVKFSGGMSGADFMAM